MKKLFIGLFILLSLASFASSYKSTVKAPLKISQKNIDENNTKIEKVIKKSISDASKKEDLTKILNSDLRKNTSETLTPLLFEGLFNIALRNTEVEIKEIEYISETKSNVKLKMKFVTVLDEKKLEEKTNEIFKKKTRLTSEQLEKLFNGPEDTEYTGEYLKSILQAYDEEMEKLPRTSEAETTISMIKKENIWEIENPNNFSNNLLMNF